MTSIVAIKTNQLPASANTPVIEKKEFSFLDLIIKNGEFHYLSDSVTAASNTFFVVPKGKTFFITNINCSAFGVGSGLISGVAITTPYIDGGASDILLQCEHMASQSNTNTMSPAIPIKAGELTEFVNVAAMPNTTCSATISGYLIDNSFLN